MNKEILINNFAIRCFRDVADRDYIAARLAYRSELFGQFHWLSLQAIEKYLKGILLLNRIPAKDISHDLQAALRYGQKLPFNIDLSESSRKFVDHIDAFGRFRYFEVSYYVHGPKLVQLDKAIWEIRRYCRSLNYEDDDLNGGKMNMLSHEIHVMREMEKMSPHLSKIPGGVLERIIDDNHHPARKALIWQNAFFGKTFRKILKMRTPYHASNSPLSLNPEVLDAVERYVYLPKDVKKAYRQRIEDEKTKSR